MKAKGDKLQVLDFLDRLGLVGAFDLINEFKYTERFARVKLTRLHNAGLIRPAITEKGKWILSARSDKRLKYLREARDGGRT